MTQSTQVQTGYRREDWRDHPLAPLLEFPFPKPREAWLLRDPSGAVRGRIGACLSPTHAGLGFIGFYELEDPDDREASDLLLTHATNFIKSHGATRAVGPLHLNTWLPYRFGLSQDPSLHFAWEPRQPEAYPAHWRSFGFAREMLYSSEGHPGFGDFVARLRPHWSRAKDLGYRFRRLDPAALMEREVPILHSLSMRGFAANFLFEPLPLQLFKQLYVPTAAKTTSRSEELSGFVISPAGEEVGFSFSFIDSTGGVPRVVLKSAAILPEHRGKGLSNALFYELLKDLDPSVHTEFVSALVRAGAQSESYGRAHGTLWRHEYELLSKPL